MKQYLNKRTKNKKWRILRYTPDTSPSDNFLVLQNAIPRQTNSKTHIPSNASQVSIRSYVSYTRPRTCVWSIKRKSKSMWHSLKTSLDLVADTYWNT